MAWCWLRKINLRRLEIEVDALAVIQLISDQNTVNHSFGNILFDCRFLMQELDVVSIKHVYCEANRYVDALANDAPISIRDFHIYPYMPSCIFKFFCMRIWLGLHTLEL